MTLKIAIFIQSRSALSTRNIMQSTKVIDIKIINDNFTFFNTKFLKSGLCFTFTVHLNLGSKISSVILAVFRFHKICR